jgi:phenylpropionate dioxygenase-like ring-hydroxylating dioxygenase large terminal subunit
MNVRQPVEPDRVHADQQICHRVIRRSNWKFVMENQLDALHASVSHQSTGVASGRIEKRIEEATGNARDCGHRGVRGLS